MTAATPAAAPVPGRLFSTRHGRPAAKGNLWFWYANRSKRVWFRIDREAFAGKAAQFRFRGRPILHSSERDGWRMGRFQQRPLFWGKRPGSGLDRGPAGTNLYLELWTRWTWIHPQAAARPDWFSVEPCTVAESQPQRS